VALASTAGRAFKKAIRCRPMRRSVRRGDCKDGKGDGGCQDRVVMCVDMGLCIACAGGFACVYLTYVVLDCIEDR